MLIKIMKLKNFRQYLDETIEFATGKKNVTIVHGENGTGKTTLLQAFNWCFYGKSDLSYSEDMLLSKTIEQGMINNEQEEITVSIEFIHKDEFYLITRNQQVKMLGEKLHYEQSNLRLKYKTKKGVWEFYSEDLPENFIHRIFPESLASYFLFDGERIKHLGDNSIKGKNDMRTAVSNIMSLDTLSNARNHMKAVKKKIIEDYSISRGDIKAKKITDDIRKKEDKIDEIEEEQTENDKNLESYQGQVKDFSDKIKGFEEVKIIEVQRVDLESQIKVEKELRNISANNVRKEYYKNSTNYLASRLFNKAEEYLNKFELEDGIIEGISAKAIDQIIARKTCLCGKEVVEGEDIYIKLMALKEFLPPKSYGSMVNEFLSKINEAKVSCLDFNEKMRDLYKDYLAKKLIISNLDNEITKRTTYLKNYDVEAVRETENKLEDMKIKYDNSNIMKGSLKEELRLAKDDLKDLENKRDSILLSNEKNLIIKRREDAANELIDYFDEYLMEQEEIVRVHLTKLVENIFNSVLHKDYKIEIMENYKFNVKDGNGRDVPMSEGEKQVTSLSFITGIVNMAKDDKLSKKFREKIGYDIQEVYPVIMDSPFGSLDVEHRTKISDVVTTLTDQTILFASSSQWIGPVENTIKDRVGKEYELEYHSIIKNGEVQEYTKINKVEM
jgi:DNA sulfur modification protein DndD